MTIQPTHDREYLQGISVSPLIPREKQKTLDCHYTVLRRNELKMYLWLRTQQAI